MIDAQERCYVDAVDADESMPFVLTMREKRAGGPNHRMLVTVDAADHHYVAETSAFVP